MSKQTELEKDIERALRRMVEDRGGACLKWTCPGWAGVPDRIILLPGGKVMFAETKRPKGGKVSQLQRWWAKRLRRLGFWVVYVWTQDDVETLDMLIRNEQEGCGL